MAVVLCCRFGLRRACRQGLARFHRHHPRFYACAGAQPLQAVDDDALVFGKAAFHHAHVAGGASQRDIAIFHRVVRPDHQDVAPVLVGADGAFGHQYGRRRVRFAEADPGELARQQRAALVGERDADAHRAVFGIDARVDQLDMSPDHGAVGEVHLDRNPIQPLRGGQKAVDRTLVGVEAGIDGIDGNHARQDRRAGTGRDEIARRHLQPPDAPGYRGANVGIGKVQPRAAQHCLCRGQLGLRLEACLDAPLVFRNGDRAVALKLRAALQFAPGVGKACLGGFQLGFGARDRGLVRRRIDGQKRRSLLDQAAFAEMGGLDGACHA